MREIRMYGFDEGLLARALRTAGWDLLKGVHSRRLRAIACPLGPPRAPPLRRDDVLENLGHGHCHLSLPSKERIGVPPGIIAIDHAL
jgi:hypothetical protein